MQYKPILVGDLVRNVLNRVLASGVMELGVVTKIQIDRDTYQSVMYHVYNLSERRIVYRYPNEINAV